MKRFKYAKAGDEIISINNKTKCKCISRIRNRDQVFIYTTNYDFSTNYDFYNLEGNSDWEDATLYYYRKGKICKQLPLLLLLKRILHLDKSEYINVVLNSDIYNQEAKLVIDKTINIKIN